MSLASRVTALASRIGAEIKGLIRPDHPGLARAWANFGYVGGAIQLRAAYNVASVTRISAGRYRVTFATAFADANYCWVATARSSTNAKPIRFAAARNTTEGKTADFLELVCTTTSASLDDTSEINLVVYR